MSHPASDAPQEAGSDLCGQILGDYRIVRKLGEGAMSDVYLADQISLRRQIAFKVLKRELAEDHTYVKRFQREAQSAASLIHPHIVQIYDVGCIDGFHFIAQEYVAGGNVLELVRRDGPLPLQRALPIMRQVASALAAAAERDIVHRDIKPENILLTPDQQAKVADFGLARQSQPAANSVDLTQVGITMGTPLYMSPEQIEGKPLDSRSDIYSFGVTSYFLLAGRLPFHAETPLAVAVQHLERTAEPLKRHRPDLPVEVSGCIHRMLAKSPSDRFPSPSEVVRAIDQLQGLPAAAASSAAGNDQVSQTVPGAAATTTTLAEVMQADAARHTDRRRNWIGYGIAIAVGILLGIVAAFWQRGDVGQSARSRLARDVPQFATVQEQWIHAVKTDNEDAWLAVRERFPESSFYVAHAERELARIYLFEQRWEEALPLFDRFASAGDDQAQRKAFGLAGRSVALCYLSRYEESALAMQRLAPRIGDLNDRPLLELVDAARSANRVALDEEHLDELKNLLQKRIDQMESEIEP